MIIHARNFTANLYGRIEIASQVIDSEYGPPTKQIVIHCGQMDTIILPADQWLNCESLKMNSAPAVIR